MQQASVDIRFLHSVPVQQFGWSSAPLSALYTELMPLQAIAALFWVACLYVLYVVWTVPYHVGAISLVALVAVFVKTAISTGVDEAMLQQNAKLK